MLPAYRGAGGGLGLDYRFRRGGTLRLSAGATHVADAESALSLTRARVGVGGGYTVRTKSFEMPLVALAWVEPWSLRTQGEAVELFEGESALRTRPLLGFGVQLEPRYRIRVRRASLSGAFVGVRTSFGASLAMPEGKAISIRQREGSELDLVVGGPELGFALVVGLNFGAPLK